LKLRSGGSQHLGSIFKMSNNPQLTETDIYGRPQNEKKISLIDSSILCKLPTASIVLTTMANSLRIAKWFINKNIDD